MSYISLFNSDNLKYETVHNYSANLNFNKHFESRRDSFDCNIYYLSLEEILLIAMFIIWVRVTFARNIALGQAFYCGYGSPWSTVKHFDHLRNSLNTNTSLHNIIVCTTISTKNILQLLPLH